MPKNLVDSEVMMGQLVGRGHELTHRAEEAARLWRVNLTRLSGLLVTREICSCVSTSVL